MKNIPERARVRPLSTYSRFDERVWRFPVKPQKVYIGASLDAQQDAMRLALNLMDAGFTVASRWLRRDYSNRPSEDSNWREHVNLCQSMCQVNLDDLAASDTLVLLTHVESTRGGLHVELGYFLGAGRENILVVGERYSVFYYDPRVMFAPRLSYPIVEFLLSPEHGQQAQPKEESTGLMFPDLSEVKVDDVEAQP